jgi:hypothetical protein
MIPTDPRRLVHPGEIVKLDALHGRTEVDVGQTLGDEILAGVDQG